MLSFCTVAFAQDVNHDGAVTYLLPVNVPDLVPGAFNTTWKTELWIHNGSLSTVNFSKCGQYVPPCALELHNPGTTELAFRVETGQSSGSLVFDIPMTVPDNIVVAPELTFSSRLFELSRGTQPAGVEIPVVREDRFLTAATRFIGIPGDSAFRAALRVYDPRRSGSATVRVELFAPDGTRRGEATLSLAGNTNPFSPGSATVTDLRSLFPQATELARYDLLLTPLTAGLEYWAMTSVTDNTTQQVFLITPN